MRKADNEQIVGGINTVDTIIDLGKDSSKKLFVLKYIIINLTYVKIVYTNLWKKIIGMKIC